MIDRNQKSHQAEFIKGSNLVTKPFLKKYLAQEFKKFRKELNGKDLVELRKKIRDEDLVKLRKEINSDFADLIDTSIILLLEKMSGDIKDIKDIVNIHKRRLDYIDGKFLNLTS